jgi:serine/threonine protein kinase
MQRRYIPIRRISQSRASIYLALDTEHNKSVVIKHKQYPRGSTKNTRREIDAIDTIKDVQGVAESLGYWCTPTTSVLIMPRYETDLHTMIANKHHFTNSNILGIMCILLKALQTVHARGRCHLDIKPENILMDQYGAPYLTDWEFSTTYKPGQLIEVWSGTIGYMSPKALARMPHNPEKSDVWSCGAVLYEIIKGTKPYESGSARGILEEISRGVQPYTSMPKGHPLTGAVKRMLTPSEKRRPTIASALKILMSNFNTS